MPFILARAKQMIYNRKHYSNSSFSISPMCISWFPCYDLNCLELEVIQFLVFKDNVFYQPNWHGWKNEMTFWAKRRAHMHKSLTDFSQYISWPNMKVLTLPIQLILPTSLDHHHSKSKQPKSLFHLYLLGVELCSKGFSVYKMISTSLEDNWTDRFFHLNYSDVVKLTKISQSNHSYRWVHATADSGCALSSVSCTSMYIFTPISVSLLGFLLVWLC